MTKPKRRGRPPKNFSWLALKRPEALDDPGIPEHVREVGKKRHVLARGLHEELGAAGQVSISEALLIDRVSRLWAYAELADMHAFDAGKPADRPPDYLGIVNSLVRAARTLNEIANEKRTKWSGDILDLKSFLAKRIEEKAPKPSANGTKVSDEPLSNEEDTSADVRAVSTDKGLDQ
jgi:hypothetical protein